MPIRKARGNMYDWPDVDLWLWDPLRGQCSHRCEYCFVQAMGRMYPAIKAKYSGPIMLDGDELMTNLARKWEGEDRTIWPVCMGDLFAEDVETWMIKAILAQCCKWPQFTYVFQTKNPARYMAHKFTWPAKLIRGTTIESDIVHHPIMSECPPPIERATEISKVRKPKFITIEPVMRFNLKKMLEFMVWAEPEFINIGADSKGCGLPEPSALDINNLIKGIQNLGIEIRQKHNLGRLTHAAMG